MKRTTKIISVIMAVLMLIMFAVPVFAAGTQITPNDLEGQIDYGDSTKLTSLAGQIMGLIRNIAVIASVIIIMVLGVKFMLGSTEEKAEYKKSLIPLIVGIILVVGATSIATFLFNMVG